MNNELIVIDHRIMNGKPVIKGTRLTVQFILGLLSRGLSFEDIKKEYNGLTNKDIEACLEFAKEAVEDLIYC